MKKYVDIEQYLRSKLKGNETLDSRLFAPSGQMHPDVRQRLLACVQNVLNDTIAGIKGLEVADIWLRGSAAGYFYTENSDIDLIIEIQKRNAPWLADDTLKLSSFLDVMYRNNARSPKLMPEERFVYISFHTSEVNETGGLYSVLHNRWKYMQNPHALDETLFADIWQKYLNRYREIDNYLLKMQISGELHFREGAEKLEHYYRELYQYPRFSERKLLVNKMLKKRGIILKIQELISESWREALSLK